MVHMLEWKTLWERYAHFAFSALFVLGVLGDIFFLPALNAGTALGYLMIVGSFLTVSYTILVVDTASVWPVVVRIATHLFPVLLGSLFSAVFVYYSRSAHVSVDLPFLLFLAIVTLGSEICSRRMELFLFRSMLWYLALVMVLTLAIPVWQNSLSWENTALSLLTALLLSWCLFLALRKGGVGWSMIRAASVGALLVTLTVCLCLALRVLPPIPLALKHAEIVYHVTPVSSGVYHLMRGNTVERFTWQAPVLSSARGTLSFYSAVYAPAQLSTTIIHEWQYIDLNRGVWITKARVGFPISGGRDMGYRGYTTVSVHPGYWRVRVMTASGAVLGMEHFRVADIPMPPLSVQSGT